MAQVVAMAARYDNIRTEVRCISGADRALTEVYLLGQTGSVPETPFEEFGAVERVIRIRQKFRALGRHEGQAEAIGFTYRGLTFSQDTFHIFAGLCAVDTAEHVEQTFAALKRLGIQTSRAGAYKPRTSPYDFQGHGKACLPQLFESAGKHDIRVIAMEVTHESHVEEISNALRQAGDPTGVFLQIGTRNAQNFELLKSVGQQDEFPVLFKRGMGVTLEESLNACEYLAASGNRRITFCLRGMKTNLGDPHRNFVDFGLVPAVKRMTRMGVCIDPSHSVGKKVRAADGLLDIFHVTAQGIIAGANMVLVDVHPDPATALCDGPQALLFPELQHLIDDASIARAAYAERLALVAKQPTDD